ncbi:uncharacterized protein LTR77_007040 [Saxophila tyrrhenica]|uniref:Cytochrome P450 n=1 Tax=Saxophila tyrrhenica TaxID=1690608 RepID=A0AAV9P3M7_9PEZI|nr:hypothetical protein LTR77_007040 [Saxophila tyrrhenica]
MDVFSSTRHPTPDIIPSPYKPTYLTWTILTIIVVALTTRLLTSAKTSATTHTKNGHPVETIPRIPYYLPYLSHLPSMAWDSTFTRRLRDQHQDGAFALDLLGMKHNIIFSPSLITALLNQPPEHVSAQPVRTKLLTNVFGMPSSSYERKVWEAAMPDLQACDRDLDQEPTLGETVDRTIRNLKSSISSLVSGAESLVDQSTWERNAGVEMKRDALGEEVVETTLRPLIRDFVARITTTTLMGETFVEKFEALWEDFWTVDRSYWLLALGWPRWVPLPGLTRAHIARKRVLEMLEAFHEAMEKQAKGEDAGAEWLELEDVSTLLKERTNVYRKHGLSMRARAALDLSLVWAANTNANALVFSMLHHIYASPEVLSRIRQEIAPFAQVVQPKQEFPIPEPSRLESVDAGGLCEGCPLLKSCYTESLRLDTAPWSTRFVEQDCVLQSKEGQTCWLLRKGEYVHAAHDLHGIDSEYFHDPLVWKADRHIRPDGDEKRAAVDLGPIPSFRSGELVSPGRDLVVKEVMCFVAAIIALWDIEPANGGKWRMPQPRTAAGVYGTSNSTRVWVKRRQLPQSN